MTPANRFFERSRGLLRAGALYCHVPVIFPLPNPLQHVWRNPDGTLGRMDFHDAYQATDEQRRQPGLQVLARAKPRPVILLTALNRSDPLLHLEQRRRVPDALVVPLYTDDRRFSGSHLFRLPGAADVDRCLEHDSYADLLKMTSVPITYLRPEHHVCDLSQDARADLFLQLAAFLKLSG